MVEQAGDLVGNARGVARGGPLPGQPCQGLLRRKAGEYRLAGILVGQFVERKAALSGDLQAALQCLGMAGEQPAHFPSRLQVAIAGTLAQETDIVDAAPGADAGHHVLEDAAGGVVVEHVAGRHRADPHLRGQAGDLVQAELILRPPPQAQRDIRVGAKYPGQATKPGGAVVVRLVRHQHRDEPLGVFGEVVPAEQAGSLAAAPLAARQQAAEATIGRPVGGIDQDRGTVGEFQPAADNQPDAGRLRRLMGADDAGQAIAIGDRQGGEPAGGGLVEQFLAGAGAAQEGEMRGAVQLGVAHPKMPCRNQRCEPVSGSSPSPARNSQ